MSSSSSSPSSSMTSTTTLARPSSASHTASTSAYDFPDDPFSETSTTSPYLQQHNNTSVPPSNSNDSLAAWAKTTRFSVLNHFSHVTNVARHGAHTLLSSPLFQPLENGGEGLRADIGSGHEATYNRRNTRSSVASLATSFLQHGPVGPLGPSDPGWKHSELAKKSGTGEYDSARVYLAKWAKLVAEEGEINRLKEQQERKNISTQQASSSLATPSRANQIEDTELGAFEIWDLLPCIDKPESTRVAESEIGQEAWSALFDDEGGPAVSFNHMRQLVFQFGFGKGKHSVHGTGWEQLGPRAECWSFLLGAQTWIKGQSSAERKAQWDEKSREYWNLRPQVEECKGTPEKEAFWKDQKHRIRVDCLRVDKKLPLFRDKSDRRVSSEKQDSEEENEMGSIHIQRLQEVLLSFVIWDQAREQEAAETELDVDEAGQLGGYVQGMSDLCAPLYSVCHGDEAKTFWLFVGLMERMRRNFYSDQSGMKMQLLSLQKLIAIMDPSLYSHLERVDGLNLFFCFRWLLVCFKREFSFPEILMVWEAIWAANLDNEEENTGVVCSTPYRGFSDHFQLFFAFAILEHHRDVLIKYLHNFDELLQVSRQLLGTFFLKKTETNAMPLIMNFLAVYERSLLSN
jgi:hypothetical protein